MNRLTSVPTNIAPIIAMESGFCSSEPMSNENSSGTIASVITVADLKTGSCSCCHPHIRCAAAGVVYVPGIRCRNNGQSRDQKSGQGSSESSF